MLGHRGQHTGIHCGCVVGDETDIITATEIRLMFLFVIGGHYMYNKLGIFIWHSEEGRKISKKSK